ncbi:putative mediator of RNA polymerase II transcription subunit 26 [Corticium candelabrum]|uniref:putative mediator of RNA polymerase II transcription subunit 26 n=1 Tax=Corticium candelabrum TaxID=121492 RepID=UPI002E2648E1|nr:putative mediator of RNA polymerase II transcription subunit 26 [Corticium candelabrum]
MTCRPLSFNVVIPNGELAQIRRWVLDHPNKETGGDLFGLWSKDNTAVVQFVLGPGKRSRRTTMSYFQDTKYLAESDSVITEQYGLCHIGEWHSHHTLGLARPSDGDQKTVWSNMPNNGFKRFIIFIANLEKETRSRTRDVELRGGTGLGCFLFQVKDTKSWEQYDVMQGYFDVTNGQSPYRHELVPMIGKGAETLYKRHEVAVEHVQSSRSQGYELGHILLYSKDQERLILLPHPQPQQQRQRQEQIQQQEIQQRQQQQQQQQPYLTTQLLPHEQQQQQQQLSSLTTLTPTPTINNFHQDPQSLLVTRIPDIPLLELTLDHLNTTGLKKVSRNINLPILINGKPPQHQLIVYHNKFPIYHNNRESIKQDIITPNHSQINKDNQTGRLPTHHNIKLLIIINKDHHTGRLPVHHNLNLLILGM